MHQNTFKKYFFLTLVFFSCAHITYAGFEITEIMYDVSGTDSNREWIEVRNTGTNQEDLSKWYLITGNVSHAISTINTTIVPAGAYAIIVQNPSKWKIDWPSYGGLLFDSSWTDLNNKGESIALKDSGGNIVSTTAYNSGLGATGNGYSLQKVGGEWISSKPTPGAENIKSVPIAKPQVISTNTKPEATSKTKIDEAPSKISNNNIVYARTSNEKEIINLDDLSASAGDSKNKISNKTLAYIGLILIVIIGVLLMEVIRRRNSKRGSDSDLRVEDMTILE